MTDPASLWWLERGFYLLSFLAAGYYGTRTGLNGVRSDVRYIRERMAEDQKREEKREAKLESEMSQVWNHISDHGTRITVLEKTVR